MTGPRVTIRRLTRLLCARWKLLVCATVLGAALGAMYGLTRKPVFESDAMLAPVRQVDESGQVGGDLGGLVGQVAGMAGFAGLASVGTSLDESVAVLNSRQFALQFMSEHGVLQYLFPDLWDAREGRWTNSGGRQQPGLLERAFGWLEPVPDSKLAWQGPGPTPDDAMKRFDRVREVVIDRRTEFIKLAVRGPTPQIAQAWAVSMIDELNQSMRDRALEESRTAVDLLSKYIATERQESIRTAAASLLEAQLRREVVAQTRKEFAVQVLDAPSLPAQRYYPRRGHMTLLGGLLGFLLASLGIIAFSVVQNERRLGAYAADR